MPNLLLTATVVALFVVLLGCIKFALQKTALGDSKTIAPAATILCLLGLSGQFQVSQEGSIAEVVLLPWAALGISLLFIVLLCLVLKLCRFSGEDDSADRETEVAGHSLWDHEDEGEWCERSMTKPLNTHARKRMRRERNICRTEGNKL